MTYDVKLELIKRNYRYLYVYLIVILPIILFSIILFTKVYNKLFGDFEAFLIIIISILLFFLFKIIPYLKFSKHTKVGYIYFSTNCIIIEDSHHERKCIRITEIDNLKIKLCGFDGQPQTGQVRNYFPAMWPVDGLNNFIKISNKNFCIKREFYIDSILSYNILKELVESWHSLANIDSNILR